MTIHGYFAQTLLHIALRRGTDIDLTATDEDYLSIGWHRPGGNCNWYPIVEVVINGKTVLHREGPENPDNWKKFLRCAAEKIIDHEYEQEATR